VYDEVMLEIEKLTKSSKASAMMEFAEEILLCPDLARETLSEKKAIVLKKKLFFPQRHL
jgi:hypothetical protein